MPSSRHSYSPPALNIYMQGDSYLYCAACELHPSNTHDLILGYVALNTGVMLHHLDKHAQAGFLGTAGLRRKLIEDDNVNFPEGGAAGGYFNEHRSVTV
jgi:hypothetical protein